MKEGKLTAAEYGIIAALVYAGWIGAMHGLLVASVDTLPKGGDAQQAPCESKGSAVGEAETPKRGNP